MIRDPQPDLPFIDENPLEAAWRKFHRENPRIYALFERFTREALAGGSRQRLGARMVWERIRWELFVGTSGERSHYRMNDHHVPYYAREFLRRNPDLGSVFELRALTSTGKRNGGTA